MEAYGRGWWCIVEPGLGVVVGLVWRLDAPVESCLQVGLEVRAPARDGEPDVGLVGDCICGVAEGAGRVFLVTAAPSACGGIFRQVESILKEVEPGGSIAFFEGSMRVGGCPGAGRVEGSERAVVLEDVFGEPLA